METDLAQEPAEGLLSRSLEDRADEFAIQQNLLGEQAVIPQHL
jgi:hypothetical protein